MTKNPRGHSSGRGIVLDITPEGINLAVQRDSSHCVIADALKAAVPAASWISVDLQTIRWTDRDAGRRYIYLTPASAQAVLVNFDQGVKPEPFTMRLGHPAQIAKVNPRMRDGKAKTPRNIQQDAHAPRNIQQDDLPKGQAKRLLPVGSSSPERVPTVLGGTLPPTAALSSTRGRRRTFGLRSLKP